MTANAALAARARDLADRAPRGSLERRAWGCAAVALSATSTIAAARSALAVLRQAGVREAALDAIGQLATERSTTP